MDRFLIAPYDANSGQQDDVRPWLIPDNAFSRLDNVYVFRGRVRKRFGSRWLGNTQLSSRLRVQIGTTDPVTGNFVGFVPRDIANIPIVTPAIGQMFSVGSTIFTVNMLGLPAVLLTTGTAIGTFNTTTGAVTITGNATNPSTAVYYYPALPVMGLLSFDSANINNEPTYAFDTRFAYEYIAGSGWSRLANEAVPGAAFWLGNNSQFFWDQTYFDADGFTRAFFVTNFNENEYVAVTHAVKMRYLLNGIWNNFRPALNATESLNAALAIVQFQNRLLAFNVWQGLTATPAATGDHYQNRVVWSRVGNPFAADSWRQDIEGRGGGLDAFTTEAIIGIEFVRNRLIVYFERSTWELVYTGNQIQPFTWQKINTELGAESTFSIIPFDKVVLGVGHVGIHACNGANVERIDSKIPDTVFDIHNANQGVERVYGVRDYFSEMVYWTFPSTTTTATFPYPNRVLVYNYATGTWAFNDDSITCFGYFQSQPPDASASWDSDTITWDSDETWGSGSLDIQFRQVVAGNQEGYTFIVDRLTATNTPALQITDITIAVAGSNIITITSIDHNMRVDDYVFFQDIVSTGNLILLNGKIFRVISSSVYPISANSFSIVYPVSTPPASTPIIAGTYRGGGVISRVSQLNIETKEFNFYASEGRNAAVSKVDFMVDRTAAGKILVDYFTSTSITSLVEASSLFGTNALLGTNVLETSAFSDIPYEATSVRLWHPVYFQANGEVIQFQLTMDDALMRDTNVRNADFQLHAMCIYAQPTSYRFQ